MCPRVRCGVVDVDVDELCAERAAEGRGEVAGLDAEDDVGAAVDHLETGQVEGAGVEVVRGRVGVVARAVVVAGRVGDVEEDGSGDEVEDDRPLGGRWRRPGDGDDVDHAVPPVTAMPTLKEPSGAAVVETTSSPSSRRCWSPRCRAGCRARSCRSRSRASRPPSSVGGACHRQGRRVLGVGDIALSG